MEKRGDFFSGIVLAAFSVGYIIYAFHYPWGSLANPGPGFLPSILGIVLLILSLNLVLRRPEGREQGNSEEAAAQVEGTSGWKRELKPLLTVLAVIVYIFLLPWIGYLMDSVFLMLSGIKIAGERSWLKPLVVTLGVSIFTYLLFVAWLEVPLPRGELISILGR